MAWFYLYIGALQVSDDDDVDDGDQSQWEIPDFVNPLTLYFYPRATDVNLKLAITLTV